MPLHLFGKCSLTIVNYVYCIGGFTEDEKHNTSCHQVWRINTNDPILEWREVAPLKQKRHVMGAAVFYEALVVAVGAGGNL